MGSYRNWSYNGLISFLLSCPLTTFTCKASMLSVLISETSVLYKIGVVLK